MKKSFIIISLIFFLVTNITALAADNDPVLVAPSSPAHSIWSSTCGSRMETCDQVMQLPRTLAQR